MGNGDAELAFASSLLDQTLEGSGRTLVPRLRGNAPAKEVDLNPVDLPYKGKGNTLMIDRSLSRKRIQKANGNGNGNGNVYVT